MKRKKKEKIKKNRKMKRERKDKQEKHNNKGRSLLKRYEKNEKEVKHMRTVKRKDRWECAGILNHKDL